MKTNARTACFVLGAAILVHSAPALAQESRGADAAQEAKAPGSDLRIESYLGGIAGPDEHGTMLGGAAIGLQSRCRIGLFEFGGFGELGQMVIDYTYLGVGATAGIAWRTPMGLRLSASGVFGVHGYSGVGLSWLGDPGGKGMLPFAGARLGVSYLFIRSKNHMELGLMGLYEDDLGRKDVRVDYWEDTWNGEPIDLTATHTVGTSRFGALLTLGYTRDFI